MHKREILFLRTLVCLSVGLLASSLLGTGCARTLSEEPTDAEAQYELGRKYDHGIGVPEDYAEAEKWYRKAAEQGFAPAQFDLGFMYFFGLGVTQDYAETARWYRKAAEQGYAVAQFRLGEMYALGQGVPKDLAEAVRLYRKVAEQEGAVLPQFRLGAMYALGQGVPQDYVQAYMWLSVSITGGEKAAVEFRDTVAQGMTREQIDEAQHLAREWWEKHKKQ